MSAHRYWRIAKLKTVGNNGLIAAEIVFYDSSGTDRTVGGYAIASAGNDDSRGNPENAFDKNNNTDFLNDYKNMSLDQSFIGYVSPDAYELSSVGLLMRQDRLIANDMWQTASLEYSDDGINWSHYGYIAPVFETSAIVTSLRVFVVITADNLSTGNFSSNTYVDIYAFDSSGSITGLVTQGKKNEPKIPLESDVLLYDRLTNKLIQSTRSDSLGVYTFNNVDIGREYYTVTIHPNRTYNAVIQDGLKPGMTT